jgi:hypothetical protein
VIADGGSPHSLGWQTEAEALDSETFSKLLAPALRHSRSLHTFYFEGCEWKDLHLSVQHNHSIILCVGPEKTGCNFSDSLLFNRVSECRCLYDRILLSRLAFSLCADFALELEPCGAGSELCAIHRSNGVGTPLLHSASH